MSTNIAEILLQKQEFTKSGFLFLYKIGIKSVNIRFPRVYTIII